MDDLVSQALKSIPRLDEIIEKVWKDLNLKVEYVRNNFSQVLLKFDEKATEVFVDFEKQALMSLTQKWINDNKSRVDRLKNTFSKDNIEVFVKELASIFVDFAFVVQRFEKNAGNMRKARGGKTFEKVIRRLLTHLGIPAEIPTGKDKEELKRIDIVIPSIKVAKEKRDKAIFLTCKRTLRERWKQELPQILPNTRFYLLTLDDNFPISKAKEIQEKGLYAYIRDDVYNKITNKYSLRPLSDLPKDLTFI